jgi:uncharacterized membrane protein YfcA
VVSPALTVAVGIVSGVLSGQFGIGGGLVTTPAIRLLLGYPALVAVGTPLPVILPTAVAGAVAYARRGLADARAGVFMGAMGAVGAVAGAGLSDLAGGPAVLIATALVIGWVAVDTGVHVVRGAAARRPSEAQRTPDGALDPPRHAAPLGWRLAALGVAAGLYSGFLGLGGGFIVVPALSRWLGWPLKRAIGTSLFTVAVLAVPGTVAHYVLGHVDPVLAAWLAVGTVPGALLGARLTAMSEEQHVAAGFAALLGVVAVCLAASEMAGLLA